MGWGLRVVQLPLRIAMGKSESIATGGMIGVGDEGPIPSIEGASTCVG